MLGLPALENGKLTSDSSPAMTDQQCIRFLQWALPRLRYRWGGFRKVRRQVHKRIDRRIHELGLEDIEAYRAYLESHPSEWNVLESFCRISISRFYRDRGVFDHLGERVFPELARSVTTRGETRLRVWCAGCASGEEPYTLAILWSIAVAPAYPRIRLELVATDIDEQLLARSKAARYASSSLKDVPSHWRETAFVHDGEEYVLKAEYRDVVEFRRQDIRTEAPPGPFELILCRHLAFTYFDERLQEAVLTRIAGRLTPGGLFVAGKQEPLPKSAEENFREENGLGIYRLV